MVFVTSYMLILPAITMEKTTYCGNTHHTHTASCYEPSEEILDEDDISGSTGSASAGISAPSWADSLSIEGIEELRTGGEDEELVGAETESETESESESESESETETESEIESESESEFESESESETDIESEHAPAIAPESESESTSESGSEPETESETASESEIESESETESAKKVTTVTLTEEATEEGTEPETETEAETKAEEGTETESEAFTEATTEPEAMTETAAELESDAETEIQTEAAAEPESDAETEFQSEADTEIATEAESESEELLDESASNETSWCNIKVTAVPTITRRRMRAMARASGATVDLDDYVTGIAILKLENGKWVRVNSGSSITEGDNIKINIDYAINGGLPSGVTDLAYQLPSNFKIQNEMSGSVMQNGKAVGTYTIRVDGSILISLDPQKFDPNSSFIGDIGFEGIASRAGEDDSEEVHFPGASETVIIKKDTSKYDLTIKKDAKVSEDFKSVDYTVTVSSNSGTYDNKITITDKFTDSWEKNASGSYTRDSFKLIKKDAAGNETEVTGYYPKFAAESDGRETFSYEDLPPLGAGEQYVVSYKANVTENTSGGGSLSNSAGAVTPGKQSWTSNKVKIPHSMIEKTGYYDQNKEEITWSITVNADEAADLGGYTLTDIFPEGVQLIEGSVSISPALPNGTTITGFPFTFPQDAGKKKYIITYKTTAPTVGTNGSTKVQNTASIGKDGKDYSSGAEVTVYSRTEGIQKSYNSEAIDNDGKTIYRWYSKLTLPSTEINGITYEDKIQSTKNANGEIVTSDGKNPHYAIASEILSALQNGTQGGYMRLHLKGGMTLNSYAEIRNAGYTLEFKFYDEKGSEVDGSNNTTHISSFSVNLHSDVAFTGTDLELYYPAYVDYSGMNEGDKWIFKNQGIYNGKTSDASHEYTKPKKLIKQVKVPHGNWYEYKESSADISYDLAGGYLEYRLFLNTSLDDNDEITVTDTLSDSGMAFDTDSVKVSFSEHWDWTSCGNGAAYDLKGGQAPQVTLSEDGKTMKIVFPKGYNKAENGTVCSNAPHSFVITYRVKISDDPIWNDPTVTSKMYKNSASWGNTTATTETVVKDRVVERLEKEGKQRTITDENGNTIYLDIVDYSVVINPGSEDLMKNSDTIQLTDTLNCPNGAKAYLEIDSVKLYEYDYAAEGHRGKELDRSMYKFQYDDSNQSTPKITLTIPDNKALLLEYTYSFDTDNAQTLSVGNKISLDGKYESQKSIEIATSASQASVSQAELMIYKVDAGDYSVRLGNAKFKLDAYDLTTGKTSVVNDVNLTEGGGTTEDAGSQRLYVTNKDGYLRFDKYVTPNAQNTLKPDVVYRLTEEEAPFGYEASSTPYYFVLLNKKTKSDIEKDKDTILKAFGEANTNAKIYYFDAKGKVSITVPNKFTGISVRKIWENSDGELKEGLKQGVKVQLYQWTSKLKGNEVILKVLEKKWNGGFSEPSHAQRIKSGGSVELKINFNWINYNIEESSEMCAYLLEQGFEKVKDTVFTKKIENINKAQEYAFDISPFFKDNFGIGSVEVAGNVISGYELDSSVSKNAIGDPIVLNDANDWEYVWTTKSDFRLPATDGEGKPYYYTVEEVDAPSDHTITYTNNNGIEVGGDEIVITNRENKKIDYTLPATGGSGTLPYMAGGIAVLASGLLYGYSLRRRRERRMG